MDNGRQGPQDAGQMHLPLGLAIWNPSSGLSLVLPAVFGLYVATRAAAAALVGRHGTPTAGRVAVGHWLPVAAVAIGAAAGGRTAIAVGVVYASAVACLTLGLGIVATTATVVPNPPDGRRAWPLLVVTGLLAFLAGLQGQLTFKNSVLLAVQGGFVLAVWRYDLRAQPRPAADARANGVLRRAYRGVQLTLAAVVCGVAAWFAIHGVEKSAATSAAPAGLWTAAFLSPLLVLPLLGTAVDLGQRGRAATAASATVGVAMLNACGLLPLVGLVANVRAYLIRTPDPLGLPAVLPSTGVVRRKLIDAGHGFDSLIAAVRHGRDGVVPYLAPARVQATAVPFPMAVWRVDVVLFLAVAALLVPIAAGRLPLGRRGGVALVLLYAAYVAGSVVVGIDRR